MDTDGTVAFDGRIEAVTDGVAVGWAWRRGDDTPVDVAIVVDGSVVAIATAKARRRGLRDAGIGNGRHGFAIALPDDLAAGEHRLAATIAPDGPALTQAAGFPGASEDPRWQTTTFVLEEQPVAGREMVPAEPEATEVSTPRPPVATIPAVHADGLVESVAGGVVTGWIGAAHTELTLRLDDVEHGRAAADRERPDLPDGARGFRFRLPDELIGAPGRRLVVCADDAPLPVAPGVLGRPDVKAEWNAAHLRLAQLDAGTERTVIGGGGWLFPAREGDDRDWDARLDAQALGRATARLAGWSAALRALRIIHVLAVLPARERLEATRRPADVEPVADRLLLQLRRAGDADGSFDLLDLFGALDDAREAGAVSVRTDPSLSVHGSAAAARALVREAAKRLPGRRVPPPPALPTLRCGAFRGRFAGQRKLVVAGSVRVELPVAITPLDTFGEVAELPDGTALASRRGPTPSHLVGRATAFQVHETPTGDPLRLAVVGLEPDDPIVICLAEGFQRVVIAPAAEPDLEALELEAPEVVLHVLHEDALFRLSAD